MLSAYYYPSGTKAEMSKNMMALKTLKAESSLLLVTSSSKYGSSLTKLIHREMNKSCLSLFSSKYFANMSFLMREIMSKYPGCAILMDSHLHVYKQYRELEEKYGYEMKPLLHLRLYKEHRHLSEWNGATKLIHPGRVVVGQYTNILLNYVCELNKKLYRGKGTQ